MSRLILPGPDPMVSVTDILQKWYCPTIVYLDLPVDNHINIAATLPNYRSLYRLEFSMDWIKQALVAQ
jgi:hypothetical protein